MKSKKYPAVYVYRSMGNSGNELKYSIRSLKNLSDWNGEVYVVGDSESWFNNISFIKPSRLMNDKYRDVYFKLGLILESDIADDFILMNDDFYITEETNLKPLHKGLLKADQESAYGE